MVMTLCFAPLQSLFLAGEFKSVQFLQRLLLRRNIKHFCKCGLELAMLAQLAYS
jgi:hypothetical protein